MGGCIEPEKAAGKEQKTSKKEVAKTKNDKQNRIQKPLQNSQTCQLPYFKKIPLQYFLKTRVTVHGDFLDPILIQHKRLGVLKQIQLMELDHKSLKKQLQGLIKSHEWTRVQSVLSSQNFIIVIREYKKEENMLRYLSKIKHNQPTIRFILYSIIQILHKLQLLNVLSLHVTLNTFSIDANGQVRLSLLYFLKNPVSYSEAVCNLAYLLFSGKLPYYNKSKLKFVYKEQKLNNISSSSRQFLEELWQKPKLKSLLQNKYFQAQLNSKDIANPQLNFHLIELMISLSLLCRGSGYQSNQYFHRFHNQLRLLPVKTQRTLKLFFQKHLFDQTNTTSIIGSSMQQKVHIYFRDKRRSAAKLLFEQIFDEDRKNLQIIINVLGFFQIANMDRLISCGTVQEGHRIIDDLIV